MLTTHNSLEKWATLLQTFTLTDWVNVDKFFRLLGVVTAGVLDLANCSANKHPDYYRKITMSREQEL